MKHLPSVWQNEYVHPVRLDQLTLCDNHLDDRYLWKLLPILRDEDMKYPLVCWVATVDFYNNKFLKVTPAWMRDRLPPPNILGNHIIMIKGGNNRYQAARDLGYDTIDCLIFNNQEDAIRYTKWFAQCDPLVNPHLEYKGLFDYK